MRYRFMTGCCVSALLMGGAGAAFAQSAQDAGEASTVEEIVVTGSRIVRKDYVADSPIVSVSAEALASRGPATLDATFNQMPQFAASNANSGTSPARQGRNNANLRGLGIQRTLILLDGRRTQPSDAFGAVDLNTISPALLESVEVITGGASAVYGSDAIAGVVNFKLRRDFEGVEIDSQYGVSDRDDAAAFSTTIAAGGRFDDGKGRFMASVGYFDRESAFRGSRPFFVRSGVASALQGGSIISNAANLPSQAALDTLFGSYGITTPAPRNSAFGVNRDGTVFTTANPILNYRFEDGDAYLIDTGRVGSALGETLPLQTPVERYTAFVRTSYELSDHVEGYFQFNHMTYDSAYSRPGFSAGSTSPLALIPVTNPFIPAALRPVLASRPNPNAPLPFVFSTSRVGRTEYEFSYALNETLVGLRGTVPGSDWTYDVYASYGTTRSQETANGFIDIASWNTLVNAADGGASICDGGFNPFLVEEMRITPGSEACYNYLNRKLTETTDFTQQVIEGTLQGRVMDLPAGEVRFAGGATYRRSSYDYNPAEERVRGTVWPYQPTAATGGSYNVREFFGELFIPVLRDLPLVSELNVDLAYRYSDYNLAGGISTYKGSVDWAFVDGLRFRGSYQRAIRAPSLGELFAPAERASAALGSTALGAGDPCDIAGVLRTSANGAQVRDLCIAQGVNASIIDSFRFAGSSVPGVFGGNTALEEETADTYTAGLVWQSRFEHPLLRGFSASLDYYSIGVDDAIGSITASVALSRCFNADGVSNPGYDAGNYFCQLTTRSPMTGAIEEQQQPTLNLASYKAAGVDLQADYVVDLQDLGLGDRGRLSFNLLVSRLLDYKIQNLADAPLLDYAGTIGNSQIDAGAFAFPDWKVSLTTAYRVGPVEVSAAYRWYDSMTHYSDVGVTNPSRVGVDDRQYLDLNAVWNVNDKTALRLGVQNVFDVEPPEWVGPGVTDLGLYDLIQRRFHVGIKRRF